MIVSFTLHAPLPVTGASDDWLARIVGSFFSTRLNTSALVDTYKEVDANVDHISFDTTLSPAGGGSMKIAVLNTDVASSGLAGFPFGQDFTDGGTFWTSFRVYAPPEFCYQLWPTSAGVGGHKLAIISNHPTNKVWEVVWQVSHNRNILEAYHQDGSGFPPFDEGAVTNCSGSDFKEQPKINNGVNPLTGTNPDTGSAWSTCEQDRAQFGGLFSAQSLSEFAYGYGDRFDGGFRQVPNEWLTLTSRIQVGNFGSSNSRVTLWAARPGQPYVKIIDKSDTLLGTPGPFNKLWLLPYVTNRVAGGRKIASRTNNITGVTLKACGLGTPIGDGTLSYTASTQRFQWKGTGESYGTARGFSAANGKLLVNVKDSVNSSTGSYVLIEVTPASLPGSDQTDTVTIADGRPDTQINYADVILSTSATGIKAPGGYLPSLDDTALSLAAAAMAPGTWALFVVSNQNAILDDTGASGSATGYSNTFPWNPVRKSIELVCGDHHGATPSMRHLRYNALTNLFEEPQTPPVVGGIGHGYDHSSVNPFNGDLYHQLYDSVDVVRKTFAGSTFSSIGVSPGERQSGIGSCWWSGSFTGGGAQGSLMTFNVTNANNVAADGQIVGYNPLTSTWFYNATGRAPSYGVNSHSLVMEYSAVKNCAVYGGGSGSPTKLWRMTSDATVTAMTDVPAGKQAKVAFGVFVNEPVTGNFLLLSAGELWELNPDGSGTWTQQTGGRAPPAGMTSVPDDPHWLCGVAIPEYSVVMFISHNPYVKNIYLYKHA